MGSLIGALGPLGVAYPVHRYLDRTKPYRWFIGLGLGAIAALVSLFLGVPVLGEEQMALLTLLKKLAGP